MSRAGYYAYINRDISDHDITDELLKAEIGAIFADNRSVYGVPRILAALKRKNTHISKDRCSRLMHELGIQGVSKRQGKPKNKGASAETSAASDLVCRDFSADKPDKLWFADITYVKTYQSWLYVAVVFDVFSRMIVGWSMDSSMQASLVDDALLMAVMRRRPKEGLIHHSDHGSQYRSLLLGKTMRKYGIKPSMGSIASPWDNAITESLMSTIKTECVHRQTFQSREEAQIEIFDYIERFYNTLRMHSALDYLSPKEFEDRYYEMLMTEESCLQN